MHVIFVLIILVCFVFVFFWLFLVKNVHVFFPEFNNCVCKFDKIKKKFIKKN